MDLFERLTLKQNMLNASSVLAASKSKQSITTDVSKVKAQRPKGGDKTEG